MHIIDPCCAHRAHKKLESIAFDALKNKDKVCKGCQIGEKMRSRFEHSRYNNRSAHSNRTGDCVHGIKLRVPLNYPDASTALKAGNRSLLFRSDRLLSLV